MKETEMSKVNKIIDKISSGIFDENDVDILLLKLRAYSDGFPLFKELSDFVAHNDLRDRGIINTSMEVMYLRMRWYVEHVAPRKDLDITSPFPL